MFKVETNIEQFKESVKLNIKQIIDGDKILREAALDAVALISDRVQQRGMRTDGELIGGGKYSTKKLKSFSTKSGGKAFDFDSVANKKQQKNRKSNDFDGGYKEFREEAGRQTDFIDLTLTGDMMGDFTVCPEGKTGYVIGFRGQFSSDKADWNEAKFGTIFQLSESESKIIQSVVNKNINEILNK